MVDKNKTLCYYIIKLRKTNKTWLLHLRFALMGMVKHITVKSEIHLMYEPQRFLVLLTKTSIQDDKIF